MHSQIRRAEFTATIPALQSAININGEENETSRIKLDIPPQDIAELVKLVALRGKVLRVTVEIAE